MGNEIDRRRVLRWCGLGLVGGLAGCVSEYGEPGPEDMPERTTTTERTTATTTTTTTTTTQESTTTTTPANPPSFEVVEYDTPDTVTIGEEFEFEVTVKNTGGAAGTFTAPLYYRAGESGWEEVATWTFEAMEPGETVTRTRTVSFDILAEIHLRLSTYGSTSVRILPLTLAVGESYHTSDNFQIEVTKISIKGAAEFETITGETTHRHARKGKNWAFVHVRVKNEAAKPQMPPSGGDFKILSGNRQFEPHSFLLNEPIEDPKPYEATELYSGIVRKGWIAYQVTAGIGRTELQVAWSQRYRDGTVAVYWEEQ